MAWDPSILTYDGSIIFAGIHALLWLVSVICGIVVYGSFDNSSDEWKQIGGFNIGIPLLTALLAVLHSWRVKNDWRLEAPLSGFVVGYAVMSVALSAVCYSPASAQGNHGASVVQIMFNSFGFGMVITFYSAYKSGGGNLPG